MNTQDPTTAITILHEAATWFVLAKPAGIHSVRQDGSDGPSVEAWLAQSRPELANLDE